jgi:hypothetical protein
MDHREAWRRTLLEWEAIKNYHKPYALIIGWTFRNPLIEHFLPSIVLVKAAAVFDEAIDDYIAGVYKRLPREYRATLEGRICFLVDRNVVTNGPQLHAARLMRNQVAHEKEATVTWQEVDTALQEFETALLAMQLVLPRPKLNFFWERSGISLSSEPGVLGLRTFNIGVRENDAVAYEANWTQTLYRLNPDAHGLE